MTNMERSSSQDNDDRELIALGYKPQFERAMGLFGDFSLGYSYMSPIAGIYALFGFALVTAGPQFFWTMPIVLAGNFLVALVFAEAASQYPIAGGVYQWSRRLAGARWGFLTGWMYFFALIGTAAGLGAGVAPYLSPLLGFEATPMANALSSAGLILLCGVVNLMGTRMLARATELGVWAGFAGLFACGVYLLLFHQVQDISVVFDDFGKNPDGGLAPLFTAALIGIWIFFGYEACGDMAEEVKGASQQVPRAIILTMLVGGTSALLITLGMLLAVPDMKAAVDGTVANPAEAVLTSAFGPFGTKLMLVCLLLVVFSATASVLASASRLLFSLARDGLIVGSSALSRIKEGSTLPVAAVIVATLIPVGIALLGVQSPNATAAAIGFATLGIYSSFLMVVIAAIVARSNGWIPEGHFKLGVFGPIITMAALIWQIGAVVNLAWPRPASDTATLVEIYLSPIVLVALFLVGLVQLLTVANSAIEGSSADRT